MLSQSSQLLFVKLLLLAGGSNNKTPSTPQVLRQLLHDKSSSTSIVKRIKEIQANYPKLVEKSGYLTFIGYEDRFGEWTQNRKGNRVLDVEVDKEEEKNKKLEIDIVKSGLEKAIDDFTLMRKQIKKPLTKRAVELLLDNLEKLAPGDEEKKIAILNQSIVNCWQGVFELKNNNNTKTRAIC